MKFLIFLTLFFGFQSFAQADTITITHNGTSYDCTSNDDGSGSCWDKCPWTFDSCASSCGGGSECWNKCPWTFDTCAATCGPKAIGTNNFLGFLRTQAERSAAEKRDLKR